MLHTAKGLHEIIKSMDIEVNEVRASGGGGKSNLWRQMQADMFNTNILTINSSEGPALGVALWQEWEQELFQCNTGM